MPTGLIGLCSIVAFLAILAGLVVKIILDKSRTEAQITWGEFAIGSTIGVVVVTLVVAGIGWKLAYDNQITFYEYWNGWELRAVEEQVACARDGLCRYEYSCDPYLVTETYSCNCDDDDCDTCTRLVTKYHDCPYVTEEYTHKVITTLGEYLIDDHVFAKNPTEWRSGGGIPGNVQRGPSQFWLDAKARCDAGKPGFVTKRMSYENYLLADEKTNLRQYSDQIDVYKKDGLLPDLQFNIRDWYWADKVYFVGLTPSRPDTWQSGVSYLNSAFGTELQGDLHLVIVKAERITNPDSYIMALKAYWQDPSVWNKNAISKNSVIIVLGTDGEKIVWGRATTGMPIGNEGLIVGVQSYFRDNFVRFAPAAVIGNLQGQFYEKVDEDSGEKKVKVRGIGEDGALRRLLWGLDNPATKYVRLSMKGNQIGDSGSGFLYLAKEIEPTDGQKWTIGIVTFIFCMGVWWLFAYIGESRPYSWR